ncbi:uncharacterized protein METZ01_LOCUS10196 [marine metagenome]|uniref:Uncharacterized protein n=1 Tax=marine metagenome TaxID=408172 RepID=A0A381NRX8_9ZZZZ
MRIVTSSPFGLIKSVVGKIEGAASSQRTRGSFKSTGNLIPIVLIKDASAWPVTPS